MEKNASINEINHYYDLIYNDEINEAEKEINRLYKRYPNDKKVLIEYAHLLLKMKKRISEAFLFLNLAKDSSNIGYINYLIGTYYLETGDFNKAKEFYNKIEYDEYKVKNSLYRNSGLMKVYMHTGEYNKALYYCNLIGTDRKNGLYDISHYNNSLSFILYKSNIKEPESDNYFQNQMVNYSKDKTLNHIEEHFYPIKNEGTIDYLLKSIFSVCEERDKSLFHSIFYDNISSEEIYDTCLNAIKDKQPNNYSYVDYYRYNFDHIIGKTYSGVETDTVEIVTYIGSKDIISVYPINKNHINLTVSYLEENIPSNKKEDYRLKLKKKPFDLSE